MRIVAIEEDLQVSFKFRFQVVVERRKSMEKIQTTPLNGTVNKINGL